MAERSEFVVDQREHQIADRRLRRLVEYVEAEIFTNPLSAPYFLKAVSDGISKFQEAEKARRDPIAQGAIRALAAVSSLKVSASFWFIVDAVYVLFPYGADSGSATIDNKLWARMIGTAKKEKVMVKTLAEIRGPDYATWWEKYVQPHLGN